jgi:GT2 family glycosyltransferase
MIAEKNMTTSIVIPTYNHWDLTEQLISDIYWNCSRPEEILIVNNGSKEMMGDRLWTRDYALQNVVRRLDIAENIGFLQASNFGVARTRGDNILLISNDVRVWKDVVVETEDMLRATPLSIVTGKVYYGDTGWNTFYGQTYPYAEGWLLGCRKEVWDGIGGFDIRYSPNDFEDVDFSTEAISRGCVLQTLPEGYVTHLGAKTLGYNPEREALTIRNREKFREKWIDKNGTLPNTETA